MKLIVILSIAEHQEKVAALLHRAGIKRFSTIPLSGYKRKKENAALNWFSPTSKEVKTNSIALFSFAPDDAVARTVEEVNQCNQNSNRAFPVHAFVLDLAQHSNFM